MSPFPLHFLSPGSSSFLYSGHSRVIGWVYTVVVTSRAHLEPAYLSIFSGEYFFHSSPVPLSTGTTSPTFKLAFSSLHFFRVFSVARNYSLHRHQNIFIRFWRSLHRFILLRVNKDYWYPCSIKETSCCLQTCSAMVQWWNQRCKEMRASVERRWRRSRDPVDHSNFVNRLVAWSFFQVRTSTYDLET